MGRRISRKLRISTTLLLFIILLCMTAIFSILTAKNGGVSQLNQKSLTTSSPSTPILLHNETALAAYPGKSGNGFSWDPYIIQNYEIDAGGIGSAIDIRNTRSYLEIRNCTISGSGSGSSDAGIRLDNCTNVKIINCTSYNNRYGIYFIDTLNSTIMGNTAIFSNTIHGIRFDDSYENLVSGMQIYSNQRGIYLSYAHNNTLSGVNASYNTGTTGIHVFRSSGAEIFGCTTSHNRYYGIEIDIDCFNSTVYGNTANYNGYDGIQIKSSSNFCNVSWNTANFNGIYGILNTWSDHTTIHDNNCSYNNLSGIGFMDAESAILYGNTMEQNSIRIRGDAKAEFNTHQMDTTNTVNGKILYYKANQVGLPETVFFNAGQIILANCNNSHVVGQDLTGASEGITLGYSFDNTIDDCNVSNSKGEHGFYLYQSHYNNISGNDASYCLLSGIRVEHSTFNNISGNVLSFNGQWGIRLYRGNKNTVYDNQIFNNSKYGIYVYDADYNFLLYNQIEYNTEDGINFNVGWNTTSSHNTIENNLKTGIKLYRSSFNNFFNNEIYNSGDYGMFIDESDYTKIINNLISTSNKSGIFLTDSLNSLILGNIVINNRLDGLSLTFGSDFTELLNNTLSTNGESGISIDNSQTTMIIAVYVSKNGMAGLSIDQTSDYTEVINSKFSFNGGYGIECNGSNGFFYYNQIYGNANCNLTKQIIDRGIDNFWYDNTILSGDCQTGPGDGGSNWWYLVAIISVIGIVALVVLIKKRS